MPNRKKSYRPPDKHNGPRPGESMPEWMRRDSERMRREAERSPRPVYVDDRQPSPCFDQVKEQIEAWLRSNVKMGTEVAVRETQGYGLRHTIALVNYLGKALEKNKLTTFIQHFPRQLIAEGGQLIYLQCLRCWK